MKSRHSATSQRPSKLCRLLLLAFTVKLAVLGLMIFEPMVTGSSGQFSQNVPGLSLFTGKVAVAAESPAASPSLPPSPVGGQAGMAGGEPFPLNESLSEFPGNPTQQRVLPGIGGNQPGEAGIAVSTDVTRDSLTRRQEELARKEQELRILDAEITEKLEQLQILENRLATMIRDAEETRDSKLRHLVDVLANMKAQQAAAVLETLDRKIAVKVLSGMRGRQAGEILTYVKPEIAAYLTESLARMQLPME